MAGPGEQRGTALNTDEALVDRRRVEEALRDSEQWLRAVLASLPVLVVAYDRDMVCTMAEGRELAAIGLRPDEIIGRRVGELVQDPQMRQSAEAALDGVVSTCSAAVGDRVLDTYHSPLRAEDGTIIGGLGVAADVTERHRMERTLRDTVDKLQRVDADRQRLLANLVTAQEEERARIAAEVHDDSLQALAAVRMRLEMLCASLDDEQRTRLGAVEHDLESAGRRLRRLLFQLRPSALDHGTLGEAVEQLLAESADRSVSTRVFDRLATSPPAGVKAVVYRIIQEAVSNALRHGRPRSVEVHLDDHEAGLLASVRDDGAGFDHDRTARAQQPGHLGLTIMRERAEIAGGWLSVESAPGRGTVVGFWVPRGGPRPVSAGNDTNPLVAG